LQQSISDFTLLDNSIVSRINSEGTSWLTPNFIFSFAHYDGQTVGSLVIKSSSSVILLGLKKIPGFSAIAEVEINRGQNSLSKLFDADVEVTEFEGNSPINNTGHGLVMSHLNSPKSPLCSSNYGSPPYTNTRKSSVSFVSPNSISTSINRRGSINSRSNSCFNYSRFDLQLSQSNESKFDVADEIYNQLSSVLTPKALAHTQLINRLIGITGDIHDVASICDMDDINERERLISIA
jgi:hypothetical protein